MHLVSVFFLLTSAHNSARPSVCYQGRTTAKLGLFFRRLLPFADRCHDRPGRSPPRGCEWRFLCARTPIIFDYSDLWLTIKYYYLPVWYNISRLGYPAPRNGGTAGRTSPKRRTWDFEDLWGKAIIFVPHGPSWTRHTSTLGLATNSPTRFHLHLGFLNHPSPSYVSFSVTHMFTSDPANVY